MAVVLGESTLPDHQLNQKKNTSGKKMDLYGLTNPKEHADLIAYLKEQKKTSPSTPSHPCIPKANIFQIQKYIPRSWRKPSAMTHPDLPGREKEKDTLKIPVNNSSHFLIDSIRSLSTQCQLSKAFKSFSLLQLQRSSSNLLIHPISSILSASTNLKALPQGKQLHAQIISLGLSDNPFLVSRLCSFYSTIGLLHDARIIVEKSSARHAMPWNLLISAYVQNKFWLASISAYKNMIERGSDVDKFTFSSVIKACGQIGDLDLGRVVHGSIKARGLELDLFINNALVSMYAKCGAMDVVKKLFEMMHDRDVVTWNCMISAYSSKGMWNETSKILEKMQLEGSKMNTITWNTVATVNTQRGRHLEALKLIPKMTMAGAFTDSVTLVIGLNSCSKIGDLQLGKEIHGLAVRLHFTEVENVMNTLITMYSRCKRIKYAYSLFCMCSNRSLITWNAMIAGFALEDQEEETFLIFQEMINSHVQPNNVTIVTVLSLCARSANLWYGRQLHCLMTKRRFDNDQYLCNSLINMYSKSEMILDSQRIFKMMSNRDGVSYTSMIAGYGMQGKGIKALKLFDEMIGCGIKPDGITMLAILSACSHAGLVTQGQMLFEEMVCFYGIVPQMEHYSCMVDLYGRTNLLRKADELIHHMPFKPSRAMLLTLLRACRVYGNIELGERLTRRLMEF